MMPEEIVAGQLEAYNDRDLERFLSYYLEDVTVRAFPSGEVLVDRSGPMFRSRYRQLFEESPELHAEVRTRIVHGRIVIDDELVTGFMGGQTRTATAIYDVGPDKIEQVWFVST